MSNFAELHMKFNRFWSFHLWSYNLMADTNMYTIFPLMAAPGLY